MSQENVEALKDVYARWAEGDFWTAEIFDPDVEVVWAEGMPDFPGRKPGVATIETGIRSLIAPWDDFVCLADQFIPVEERVLVLVTARGRGKGSGVEVQAQWAHLWTFREGKATRFEWFIDRGEARKAADGGGS
jgi:uncharacterized protein